jgi:hypothetical protein
MADLTQIQKGSIQEVPDYIKAMHGNEGLENVNKNDILLPRLAICQSGTPQRKPTNSLYIPGLNEGQFFNSVTNEIYGSTVELIPLLKTQSRIYFRDLKEGGGILCRSFNGIDGGTIAPRCIECPNSVGFPSACTEFKNFASIVAKDRNLIVASFKSTGLAAAKAWITRMSMMHKPSFVGVYELSLVSRTKKEGDFFVPVVNFKRWSSQDEVTYAMSEYQGLKGKNIQTDEELSAESGSQENDQDITF